MFRLTTKNNAKTAIAASKRAIEYLRSIVKLLLLIVPK